MSAHSDVDNLLKLLGTAWSRYAPDPLFVSANASAVLQLSQQQERFLESARLGLSRELLPLFRVDNWFWLELRLDNQTVGADGWYEWPVPPTLVSASAVVDHMFSPSVVLHEKTDFVVDNGLIRFREDPSNRLLQSTNKQQIGGWLFAAKEDVSDLFRQFGYAVGLQARSGRNYQRLLNAVYDALVSGPTLREITLAISAATGISVTYFNDEVVEQVSKTNTQLLITTNKHIYQFHVDDTAIVAPGDRLKLGQPLTSSLVVAPLSNPQILSKIDALALDKDLLQSCFRGGLIFENRELPLSVNTAHPSKLTYVKWPLGGLRGDVDYFFDTVHERGLFVYNNVDPTCLPEKDKFTALIDGQPVVKAKGTLAQRWDTRSVPIGEPEAHHLPATINPCKFLLAQGFRDHVLYVDVDLSKAKQETPRLLTAALQKILPPEQHLMLQLRLPQQSQSVTVENMSTSIGSAVLLEIDAQEITTASHELSSWIYEA